MKDNLHSEILTQIQSGKSIQDSITKAFANIDDSNSQFFANSKFRKRLKRRKKLLVQLLQLQSLQVRMERRCFTLQTVETLELFSSE